MSKFIILLIIMPLIGAFLCLLEKLFPRIRIAPAVCVLTLVLCLLVLGSLYPSIASNQHFTYTVGGWNEVAGIRQFFDGFTWFGCTLLFVVSLPILLFAIAEQRYEVTFYFFYLLMLASMAGVLLAADLFNMFVFFEILGISSYILIAYFQKPLAFWASFKYLVLSSVGMTFFLIGIFIIYQRSGSLSLFEASQRLTSDIHYSRQISFAVTAMVTGISVRTAYIPFHAWLPEAHASAPHPVSAMLSGIVIKISFLTIWRILDVFQLATLRHLFVWIGAGAALIGVFWALCQIDCKKLLAWHSISQIGYILTAYGVEQPLSSVASLYHLMNHALFKSLLFLCIGSVIVITGERNLKLLGNLGQHLPLLMILFLVGAFSIMGIPPFNGFVSKKMIQTGLKDYPLIGSIFWLAGIGTMASFLKLSVIFRKNPYQSAETASPETGFSRSGYAALIFLAALCLWTGLARDFFSSQIALFLFGHALGGGKIIVYSAVNVVKTGLSLVFALGVYRLLFSQPGHHFTTLVRKLRLSFHASLILCVLGFVLLAIHAGW